MSEYYPGPPDSAPPYPQTPVPQSGYPPFEPPPFEPPPPYPYAGQPYGWAPAPAPPPRRTGLWVGLGVGALVVVLAIAGVAAVHLARSGRTGATHTLSIPGAFASHDLLTGSTAQDMKARVQDGFLTAGADAQRLLKGAQLGVYGPVADRAPAVLFIGISAQDGPDVARNLHAETDRAHTNEFLDGSGATGITEYGAGSLGGSLKCGSVPNFGAECVWADYSTMGIVIFYDDTTPAQAAVDSVALRTAAEH